MRVWETNQVTIDGMASIDIRGMYDEFLEFNGHNCPRNVHMTS